MRDLTAAWLARAGLPPAFRRREITLAPGTEHPYDERDWDDAVVVLVRGCMEVEGRCGRRERFSAGAVMCLAGLPLRCIRSVGDDPAVLVAVSRRRPGP